MARPTKVTDATTVAVRIDKHLYEWLDDKRFDLRMDRPDFFRYIFSDFAAKNDYKAPAKKAPAKVDADSAD